MTGRNANIYFPKQTYNKLRQIAGTRISRFVSEAVEEKIQREEQQKEEKFRQELIADYKSVTKNKKIQKEMEIWDETISDMWRGEVKTSKKKKMNNLTSSKEFPLEGDIWLVKFDKLKEFSKPFRPCLIVSNNTQNEFDDKIVVVPIDSNILSVRIKNIPLLWGR